jgi:hypothetical protein
VRAKQRERGLDDADVPVPDMRVVFYSIDLEWNVLSLFPLIFFFFLFISFVLTSGIGNRGENAAVKSVEKGEGEG